MKSRNEVLYLLEETQEKRDAAGFLIEEEETQSCQREVFCSVDSVKRNEFFEAMRSGIRLALVFHIAVDDYQGETILIYENTKYNIEKTYRLNEYDLELSVSEL